METLLKKPDSFIICLSDTLPPHSKGKKLMAPAGEIPIKYFEVLLHLKFDHVCALAVRFLGLSINISLHTVMHTQSLNFFYNSGADAS